jgi:hypothetical protein
MSEQGLMLGSVSLDEYISEHMKGTVTGRFYGVRKDEIESELRDASVPILIYLSRRGF